jgi:hypothetical protein
MQPKLANFWGGALLAAAFALPALSHAAEVDQRLHHEAARIHQGVQSGQLTHREADHLRAEKRAIKRETRSLRARNSGYLTHRQRARINRQENRLSRQVYHEKHDAQVRY